MSHCGLFILGMHRSGTSLAAGLARLAGISLGRNLLVGSSPENPRGFWEHHEVLAIDEAILRGLSLAWNVPAPLPTDWLDHPRVSPLSERAQGTLREEFAGAEAWAIKDPRLCRLSPFWERAASGLGVEVRAVHVFRHPGEVAASLAARNRMPREQAIALWLFYVTEVAAAWNDRPILHLPLERLVADPGNAATAIRGLAGLTEPLPPAAGRRIERFVEPTLLHRSPAAPAQPATLEPLALTCHDALIRLADHPDNQAALDLLAAAHRHLLEHHTALRTAARAAPMIDVVIPVHRDRRATLACIDSVRSGGGDFELIVIDDASPEPELVAELRDRAHQGQFTLLTNEQNLGFVATANRGLALHGDRDVVLLNADTVVPSGWLARLAAAARGDFVGTVTPFSNNATIASYPVPLEANPLPEGWNLAELDAACRAANAGWSIDLPTAVGFCMYIRRDCLTDVGSFDVDRFGRGYGEENDFSLRAAARGWRNVLAADLFVFHQGRASFGSEADELGRRATETIQSIHPHYAETVQRFLDEDPLADAREAIDRVRIERRGPVEARAVLADRRRHEANRLTSARSRIDELLANVTALDRALGRAETLAAERLEETRRLDAALGTTAALAAERLTEIERLDRSLGTAERLAAERLAQVEQLDRSLGSVERMATERLGETHRLDRALGEAETLAAERLAEIARLDATLGVAQDLATSRLVELTARDAQLRDTAAALATTQSLAVERLATAEALDRQVRETAAALAKVEDLARDRLRQIEELTRQVEVFTAGLNDPPGRRR